MASTQSEDPNDPFDSLLTLEDTLYTTAYTSGSLAGALAGRTEGRFFGLENGFEKFTTLGALHGRSVIWGARTLADSKVERKVETLIPRLSDNTRLRNNVVLLHSLTDPMTFSTENTEDAVADFDDRVKRAGAKAKVIERIVGEGAQDAVVVQGKVKNLRVKEGIKKGDNSMEDFAGSRLIR
ncbi:hypothetical protein GQ44DRAFT_633998 [Phaeosphaeriaceae sp. PMI808]|nr:hypothetical protein GQ44DRAFT_633998 [Phaeosphaeriaceae sp. PMI808]